MDPSQKILAIGRVESGSIRLLGTAFAVGANRWATAYHVVGPDDRDLFLIAPRVVSLADYQDTSDQSVQTMPLRLTAADPIRDLVVLEMTNGSRLGDHFSLGSADHVVPGAAVTTFGFPHANAGRMVLTQQQAHVGARVLIENAGQKSKHIVLNTQAREGQSGGPVIDPTTGRVVSVLLGSYAPGGGGQISLGGVDPATLHQTTHAISADYLSEML